MEINALSLLVLLPLLVAVINLFLPVPGRKILTFAGVVITLYLSVALFRSPEGSVRIFAEQVFATDHMALFTLLFVQGLSLIILIFSLKGVEAEISGHFFVLYPLTLAFCNGVLLSVHMISFMIFWGLSGLSLYLFALLGQREDSPQTAKKTFIIVGGSDAFLILGFVLMWILQPAAGWSLGEMQIPLKSSGAYLAFLCLLVAAFAKAGGFPMHSWIPDFSRDAPVESAAFLPASLDKLLGIYLLAKMMISLFTVSLLLNMIVITLGAVTVITAVMMAMIQHNGRKLLGYHAVSQVGYMIMGVGSGSVLAFAGGLFHMVNHTIYKSNLFLSLGAVEKRTGTNELDDLGGLGKVMPLTFIMALVGALSISGIPPFNGFFSKWMIYQGLLERTAELTAGFQLWMLLCLILAVFGSALTLASFMKFLHAVFLGKTLDKYATIREAPANQWLATGILAVLCVGFGLFAVQGPLSQFIYPVLAEAGLEIPEFLGSYSPLLLLGLFSLALLIGLLVYVVAANVRYDEIYLGGMAAEEKFRIVGSEFYNEVRNMAFLRSMYNAAAKKYFDLYDLGGRSTFAFSRLFRRAHPGQLQLYLLYILLGFLVFLLVLR